MPRGPLFPSVAVTVSRQTQRAIGWRNSLTYPATGLSPLAPRSGLERSDFVRWHSSDGSIAIGRVGSLAFSGLVYDGREPTRLTLTRHSAPGQETETSATPGPSGESWFGDCDKLFQPFVTMKLGAPG